MALQLAIFPAGQLVAELDGVIVGCASALVILWDEWADEHTWKQITAAGTFKTHNPAGFTLYGAEVFVDPSLRGKHIGHELYEGIVARMGGDEFAVIFPEVDFDAADLAAHKLFDAVNRALAKYHPVGVSVGMAWFDVPNGPLSTMLKTADDLMYAVKADGKNNLLTRRYCSAKPANGR